MKKETGKTGIREVTSMDLSLDCNNVFNTDIQTQSVYSDSIPDALIISLATLGKVNIEYISSVTGADYNSFISELIGFFYEFSFRW